MIKGDASRKTQEMRDHAQRMRSKRQLQLRA
jgi:hypothetical protein